MVKRIALHPFRGGKARHIEINHDIFINIIQIARLFRDVQGVKEFARITGVIVIRAEHLRREGLAKTPRPADARELSGCLQGGIDPGDQTSLIHIT